MAVKIETRKPALRRQQMILTVLGYYEGKCDAIWSKDTIAAMRKFEASGKFAPALPRNGLPLDLYGKMPPGIYRDTVNATAGAGLLTCAGITADKIAELTPNSSDDAPEVVLSDKSDASTGHAGNVGTVGDVGNVGDVGTVGIQGGDGEAGPAAPTTDVPTTDTSTGSGEVEFANIATNKPANTQLTKAQRKELNRQQHEQRMAQNKKS